MLQATQATDETQDVGFEDFVKEVKADYRLVCLSRETSLLGRKEVLTGKAKFGIFGDGQEVAQVAAAKFFKPGDFRSGYYRDQTFVFAAGLATVQQFFAQLYADPNLENDPFSAGRQMNAHFATPNVQTDGTWLSLANTKNISSDIAPTAAQMPRGLGLAFASKAFRNIAELKGHTNLSNNGNEVCFCTIGDSSTSEGHFWETVNAAGVLQVPLAIFVWDNGYGISVPKEQQTTKGSISDVLAGFQQTENSKGIDIYKLKGWDYQGMCEVLEPAIEKIRTTHTPAIFHIDEITQPQGHSTSGSHERYKTPERLEWEREWDCLKQMRLWILGNNIATETELDEIETNAKIEVKQGKDAAWENYLAPIKEQVAQTVTLLQKYAATNPQVAQLINTLSTEREPLRRQVIKTLFLALQAIPNDTSLSNYYQQLTNQNKQHYNSKLYNQGPKSALLVGNSNALYSPDAPTINGFEILNNYFDALFAANPTVLAFGEDLGYIGDVNQGFSGLQAKYGQHRIFDTGIRELTIMGQGIGLALRGLRPIAEIQYLDYLLYGLQPLSDDVCTTHYRTAGTQSCPLIVRTRGHRLEGIWHSGSPMAMILGALRGMYVCVPRNMVQAVGMYNTLLKSNDPGIVIECLNGYRLKEQLPNNLLEYTVALGHPEILQEGTDITIVSYGSTLRLVQEAAQTLAQKNISAEVIDVQTLLPFDVNHTILHSLKKTSRILFVDEDVPGGATAYMYTEVLENQGGFKYLDATPRTLTAQAHRPSYGSDGDYFSKPNTENIIAMVQTIVAE
jgi:pyruvate/2-oxoglutarate/acetoin dehydrogenase E1 component/TPP-dependent pyruvate/acetoin dehydrogenase alpha subunit